MIANMSKRGGFPGMGGFGGMNINQLITSYMGIIG